MAWAEISLALGVALVVAYRVWRRWIEPWHELDELVSDIVAGKPPRKFLMSANSPAHSIGLALEKIFARQSELERSAHDGTLSLHTILSALPDGLAVVDERGRIQLTNEEFRRAFGEVVSGAALFEAVRDVAVEGLLRAALEKGEAQRGAMRISKSPNERVDFEVSAVPFGKPPAGAGGAVVLFRDVTSVRQVEEMRRDFVANVSHELRTPLSIFRGYLETLLDDPQQAPEEIVRILQVMDRHAERLTLLVEDILSLAKLETPGARLHLTEIYLPDFLAGILRDWEKRFSAKLLQAKLDVSDELPVISVDEHRLQEVIYNLLDNALKYSQPEGKIRLRAEQDDDCMRISVMDEGSGIPARDLPRVFERFYRADKARSRQIGGTGLGLSIVKHIAQLHGGTVEAASEQGRGTTITIALPLRPPAVFEEQLEVAQPQLQF